MKNNINNDFRENYIATFILHALGDTIGYKNSIWEFNYNIVNFNDIRETIESMNNFNQIEILRILNKYKNSITINENKNGIYINLSDMNKNVLDELITYIKYVNTQELSLYNVEKQKESFKNIYFTKDNKDMTKIINNELTKLK